MFCYIKKYTALLICVGYVFVLPEYINIHITCHYRRLTGHFQ